MPHECRLSIAVLHCVLWEYVLGKLAKGELGDFGLFSLAKHSGVIKNRFVVKRYLRLLVDGQHITSEMSSYESIGSPHIGTTTLFQLSL